MNVHMLRLRKVSLLTACESHGSKFTAEHVNNHVNMSPFKFPNESVFGVLFTKPMNIENLQYIVGGFNPSEKKHWSNWIISPGTIGGTIKIFEKTTTKLNMDVGYQLLLPFSFPLNFFVDISRGADFILSLHMLLIGTCNVTVQRLSIKVPHVRCLFKITRQFVLCLQRDKQPGFCELIIIKRPPNYSLIFGIPESPCGWGDDIRDANAHQPSENPSATKDSLCATRKKKTKKHPILAALIPPHFW